MSSQLTFSSRSLILFALKKDPFLPMRVKSKNNLSLEKRGYVNFISTAVIKMPNKTIQKEYRT